jgi:protein gp37
MSTGIEWTEETWNPLTGCARVSPGCDNCYAAREAAGRLSGHRAYSGLAVRPAGGPAEFTGEIRLHPDRLDQPLRWRRPRQVFVNSMSDLFHPDVPVGFIAQVFATMGEADRHTFQVLTKRPQRMLDLLASESFWTDAMIEGTHPDEEASGIGFWYDCLRSCCMPNHVPNVWLGTSIESDRYTFRAGHLRATPAALRFLSLEPLLGPLPSLDLTGIDWVIVGGESGPGARPMHPNWVRDIRDRCVAAGVPFFFKQFGAWAPAEQVPDASMAQLAKAVGWADGQAMVPVGKKAAGRLLDGRTWDEMPEAVTSDA